MHNEWPIVLWIQGVISLVYLYCDCRLNSGEQENYLALRLQPQDSWSFFWGIVCHPFCLSQAAQPNVIDLLSKIRLSHILDYRSFMISTIFLLLQICAFWPQKLEMEFLDTFGWKVRHTNVSLLYLSRWVSATLLLSSWSVDERYNKGRQHAVDNNTLHAMHTSWARIFRTRFTVSAADPTKQGMHKS